MTEIHDLLKLGAGDEPIGFTTADVEGRVRARAHRRRITVATAVVLVLVAGAVGTLVMWPEADHDQHVATEGADRPEAPGLPDDSDPSPPPTEGVEVPPFEVLHAGEWWGGHIGMLGSATDAVELDLLWQAFELGPSLPRPEVDFDRRVVVGITIPDDDCPPELVDFRIDGAVLVPVFQQPDGGCIEPLIPKVYVVALSHDLAPPGSILRYPDDRELQIRRRGPREIAIWPEDVVAPAATDLVEVEVHLSLQTDGDCSATTPVLRHVPRGATAAEAIATTLAELFAGPTPRELAVVGSSQFGPATDGALERVEVEDGIAHVDLVPVITEIDNVSTSCGSSALMASLTRTVTQFDGVDSVVFYLGGDAAAFYGSLESTAPPQARPPGW